MSNDEIKAKAIEENWKWVRTHGIWAVLCISLLVWNEVKDYQQEEAISKLVKTLGETRAMQGERVAAALEKIADKQ